MVQKSVYADTELAHADECVLAFSGPLIKQISFSVSLNMLRTSQTIYQFIFDSTLKDIC